MDSDAMRAGVDGHHDENWIWTTTVMIRNIHNHYSAEELLREFSLRGFAGSFDFFYLPIDFRTYKCKGYAFLNFTSSQELLRFYEDFHDKPMLFHNKREKTVKLFPSATQGLHATVCWYLTGRRFCKISNPWFQPLLFPRNGLLIAYPLYRNCMLMKTAKTRISSMKISSIDEFASNIIYKLQCVQDNLGVSGSYRLATRTEESTFCGYELEDTISDNDVLCSLMKSAVSEICCTIGVKWQAWKHNSWNVQSILCLLAMSWAQLVKFAIHEVVHFVCWLCHEHCTPFVHRLCYVLLRTPYPDGTPV